MARDKKEQHASYRPMPNKNRFWVHAENCYTEEELALREWILKTRANSGIDPDYLTNPSSWFAEDKQAFINVYEHAWFYSNAYKTRQVLSRDDFHVQPIDNQRLQWPPLYELMQNVGDYLLLRNKNLPSDHLNQPLNFFYLDINFILKQISQNPHIGQVKEQLEILTRYVRTIEKNISPTIGSDRLFMANFRRVIEEGIEPQLTHQIETQLLKERLGELTKNIKKLSGDRNRILHFALNVNPVNPHPYDFSTPSLDDKSAYPTQVAKDCGSTGKEISTELNSILQLTKEQLKDCPNFNLISMDEEILNHYSGAISDLNELDRFQKVISQTMDLLSQAGEVYTVYQFKEQMLSLLNQIEGFIDLSSQHIEAIVHANTQAYHKAIELEQNLSIWQKLFTSEQEKLRTFIKNQDTLAQFPSTTADLSKTGKVLKGQVSEVIRHLNQPEIKTTSFEKLAGKAQELNSLMLSMHGWIKNQYKIKGLVAPKPPEPLILLPPPIEKSPARISTANPSIMVKSLPRSEESFFCPQSASANLCAPNNSECLRMVASPEPTNASFGYLSLIVLLPIGIIILLLIIQYKNKPEVIEYGNQAEYEDLKIKFDDIVAKIRGCEVYEQLGFANEYEHLILDYDELNAEAKKGKFNVVELNDLCEDLEYFYQQIAGKCLTSALSPTSM